MISASAFFKVHSSGQSGIIVLANGQESYRLHSKRAAYDIVEEALKAKLIDKFEEKILVDQIDDTMMPFHIQMEDAIRAGKLTISGGEKDYFKPAPKIQPPTVQ